jgi:hypothetical protein
LDIQQQGGHFQGISARGRKQGLVEAIRLLKPPMAQLGEPMITRQHALVEHLSDIPDLIARLVMPIESYAHQVSWLDMEFSIERVS